MLLEGFWAAHRWTAHGLSRERLLGYQAGESYIWPVTLGGWCNVVTE